MSSNLLKPKCAPVWGTGKRTGEGRGWLKTTLLAGLMAYAAMSTPKTVLETTLLKQKENRDNG